MFIDLSKAVLDIVLFKLKLLHAGVVQDSKLNPLIACLDYKVIGDQVTTWPLIFLLHLTEF